MYISMYRTLISLAEKGMDQKNNKGARGEEGEGAGGKVMGGAGERERF